MTRIANYLGLVGNSMPRDMMSTQEWLFAVDSFDFADPEPLAELLSSGEAIPEPYRTAVADIVRGKRKPNKKAAAKLKVPARERLKIAASVSTVLGLIDVIKHEAIEPEYSADKGVNLYAAKEGKEPAEVRAELEAEAREVIAMAADDLGVSTETIENLLRALRKKAKQWPAV